MARTPNRPQPGTPMDDILARLNENFDAIDDQDETKIIRNGSTPTMLIGRHVGGFNGNDYGMKVARPGFDVTTATAEQLLFDSSSETQMLYNGGIPTVLYGKQVGGFGSNDYGFKVAKPGFNVTTATDDQLIFSSAFNLLKIVKTGTMTVGYTAGIFVQDTTVAHGRAAAPPFQAYVLNPYSNEVGSYPLPWGNYSSGLSEVISEVNLSAFVNATDLVIRVTDAEAGGTPFATSYTVRYYIFAESLA